MSTYEVADSYLAPALDGLSRQSDEEGELRFVDYGFIGVRELGSVYEGLLEFSLRMANEDLVVIKEKGKEVYKPKASHRRGRTYGEVKAGEPYLVNDKKERKATGSYYTPRYIVDYIVRNTLEPLVQSRREALSEKLEAGTTGSEALETLLDVKVLDPAMGSGHFWLLRWTT